VAESFLKFLVFKRELVACALFKMRAKIMMLAHIAGALNNKEIDM